MRAILVGATGLVGNSLLQQLLQDPVFTNIRLISRRTTGIRSARLEEVLIDFDDTTQFAAAVTSADVLFCCIGTTQKKVKGDTAAYRKIDVDIPVQAAILAAAQNISKYLLVSAVGANAASRNFYLQLKGEAESAIMNQPIAIVYSMRPSILLGKRKEFRLLETIGQGVMQLLSILLAGKLSRYKAIAAADVARALVTASKQTATGRFIWEYKEMMANI